MWKIWDEAKRLGSCLSSGPFFTRMCGACSYELTLLARPFRDATGSMKPVDESIEGWREMVKRRGERRAREKLAKWEKSRMGLDFGVEL